MIVPGSNILGMALGVIGSQTVKWFAFQGVTTGPTGLDTSTYATGVDIVKGSVQPVDRARYSELGLDWQKNYITWFVPNVVAQTIKRDPDGNGDVIEWNARRYQIVGDTPWSAIDSWTRLLCIELGPATGNTTNA